MSEPAGNASTVAKAMWTFTPAFAFSTYKGTEFAQVAQINKVGAAILANSRAAPYIGDPQFFTLTADDEPLSFQVMLSNLQISQQTAAASPGSGNLADVFYSWSVTFGAGDVPGANTIFSASGGQDFTSPGVLTPNPGMAVNYANDTLPADHYWLMADLTGGAQVVPEPTGLALLGIGVAALAALRGRRQAHPAAI